MNQVIRVSLLVGCITLLGMGSFAYGQSKSTQSVAALKKLNINEASQAQLMQVRGIGPQRAAAIITYRHQHGKFTKVGQLTGVKGIKAKYLAKLKPYITTAVDQRGVNMR